MLIPSMTIASTPCHVKAVLVDELIIVQYDILVIHQAFCQMHAAAMLIS